MDEMECVCALKTLTVGGTDIENYVIVIPNGKPVSEWRTAVLLRDLVARLTGKSLDIVSASEAAEKTCQIRIGALLETAAVTRAHGYAVTVRGTVMEIAAASYYGYIAAQRYLCEQLLIVTDIPSGFGATGMSDAEEIPTVAKVGDLRLMENNVYGFKAYRQDEEYDLAQRLGALLEIYRTYAPDVLGLQEYHNIVREIMDPQLLSMGYKEVPIQSHSLYPDRMLYSKHDERMTNEKYMNTAVNSTPIYYDPNAVELLTYGYFWYSDIDYANKAFDGMRGEYEPEKLARSNDYSKGVTWAIFRSRATGKEFMFGATHLCYNRDGEVAETNREIQVCYGKELMLAESNKWLAAHHPESAPGSLPIFIGGDYNTNNLRRAYAHAAEQTPTVEGTGNNIFENLNDLSVGETIANTTTHGYAYYDAARGIYHKPQYNTTPYNYSIDYILANQSAKDGFTVRRMVRIADLYSYLSTDHCPIFTDIAFKNVFFHHKTFL